MPFTKGHTINIGRKWSLERNQKISVAMSGQGNGNWKGGKKICDGYLLVWIPGHPRADSHGYVSEHRLAMEARLGRYLDPAEVVHHINGIKDDNRDENLMLFPDNGTHLAFHKKQGGKA